MGFHFVMVYVGIKDLSRLVYVLFGVIPLTLGQICSCSNSGNCDFTHQCLPEEACVKENVALGKVANISSQNVNSGPACLMVNGNTTMVYSTKNCVKSGDQDNYPSWTVDLGRDYTINSLSIYPESSYPRGLRAVEITVDGRFCYTFNSTLYYNAREDVQCTQPQRGRIVKLYSSDNYYIFFCELQIWVCIDGYYGNDCGFRCGNCLQGVCDKINGTCLTGCEAGWQNNYCNQECDDGYYGLNCNHTCGKCANFNICNKTTGVCPGGCDSGWATPYCNQTCDNRTYGQNCSSLCGNCANGEPCDKISGACLICEPGLKPSLCQLACDFGTYGQNCSNLCGHCAKGDPCDNVNGQCISCEPGMKQHLCQQTCDNFKYGLNCSNNCGKCTNGEPCDKVNGMCLSCEIGWQIPLCQQEVVTSDNSVNTVGAIVGAILGGFAILGIIIAVPLVIYLRRFKSRSSDSRTKPSTELQPTSDKSASIKSPTNVESANEYDEMENHYNNLHPTDQSEQHNYILPAFEERNAKPAKDKPVYVNTITSDI